MMILKYLCCKERLSATVKTGEVRAISGPSPALTLMIHIQLSMGSITPAIDFLYLSQQHDTPPFMDPHAPLVKNSHASNTASTTAAT